MPLLKKGVLIPVKGIDFSQPSTFIDDRAGFPTNMRYFQSTMRKRPGKTVMGAVVSDSTQIMGFGVLEMASGTKHLIRVSKAKLERYNTATSTWVSIASTDFTGGNDDFFSFATVTESNFIAFTNGYDSIRKWTGSGNNSVLGGSPGKAKYLTYCSPYLLAAHTDDGITVKPWEVKWSDTDAPEVWSGGNSGSALLSRDSSPIQNIMKLNEFVAAYKKQSLWMGRPSDSEIFIFEPVKTGIGLAAPRALAEANGQHYFMGFNDFYVRNEVREESIGKEVREEVFSRINSEKLSRCFALHVQGLNEIWFFVVITGYDWPTEVWKYNYRTGFWYMDTCDQLTSAISWERVESKSWDDMSGSWDSQQLKWDDNTSTISGEEVVFGLSTGYTQILDYSTTNDNGVAVSAFFTTKDFTGEVLERHKRWLEVKVDAKGVGKLYVDYSINEGNTWVNIPHTSSVVYADLTGDYGWYSFYFDVVSDKIRLRFRNAVSGETFYIRNLYPYYLVREELRR